MNTLLARTNESEKIRVYLKKIGILADFKFADRSKDMEYNRTESTEEMPS